jgi:NAD(P) transhydrogenase subunit alpha
MARGMRPGSVIVDLAAERGGNCELTRAGETVEEGGVSILGPMNIPASIPFHASQMYAKNVTTFLLNMVKEGALVIDPEDEIVRGSLVARDGEVVQPQVREALGLDPGSAQKGDA